MTTQLSPLENAVNIMIMARDLLRNGASIADAMSFAAGLAEEKFDGESSPFDLDGFARALSFSLTDSAGFRFDMLCKSLQFIDGAFVLDVRKMKITTNAGMTLYAPVWSLQVLPEANRVSGYWDMRLGLSRNTEYWLSVKAADIKSTEYI